MINYNLFYKETLPVDGDWDYQPDVFISAYNESDRVKVVYNKISSPVKHWMILPDYQELDDESIYEKLNTELFFSHNDCEFEANYAEEYFKWDEARGIDFARVNLCIDTTGFVKPYLMALIYYLVVIKKLRKIDFIFSEPQEYQKKHLTQFSTGEELVTRGVNGYTGIGHREYLDDILIIGAGFDHELISRAVKENNSAKKKIQIFGFPSLRADMYQQNIFRASKADTGRNINFNGGMDLYAPANDPFATAALLQEIFAKYQDKDVNWYLSPLATKAQMLGFILFYLNECVGKPVTINYPFSKSHSVETSKGTARIWKYTLEFPGLT